MSEQFSARVWISVVIALIVVLAIVWSVPKQLFMPQGIFLPSKISRSSVTNTNIPLYANMPEFYQDLGSIRIIRHYNVDDEKLAEQQIVDLARQMAAKVGANAIVVKIFAHSMPGSPAAHAVYQFSGMAIHTHNLSLHDGSL